jgi:transcriptional regulator with XRE-family HTH domain
MGYARPKPEHLADKLRQIRDALGISQSDLHRLLGVDDFIPFRKISDYELGKREPPLVVLLEYARVAGIHMEALVSDKLELPRKLPGDVKQETINRKYARKS